MRSENAVIIAKSSSYNTRNSSKQVRRGEIYYAELLDGTGSEQNGIRPVLIVQNDKGNRHSPTTIVVSLTKMTKKMDLPVHVEIPKEISLLDHNSVVLCEQIRTIDKKRLVRRVSQLDEKTMELINEKLLISIGLHNIFS